MNSLANQIIETIKVDFNSQKAKWLENYVKHDIRSWGVGIPRLKVIVQDYASTWQGLNFSKQSQVMDDLVEHPYTEAKLAAVLYAQLYLKEIPNAKLLPLISKWFDRHWINDWNVCDWLCVRIITPRIEESILKTLAVWNKSTYLWKARASLVSFPQVKDLPKYWKPVREFAVRMIKREERFAKSGVGWLLREYSRHDSKEVLQFIEEYQQWMIPEVIRNATKYIKR